MYKCYLVGCNKSYHSLFLYVLPCLLNCKIMKKNMGNADRTVRLLVAMVVAVLYFTNIITGTLGIVLLVVAGVFVLTSLVSFCPLYRLVGLNSCPVKNKQVLK